MSVFRVVTAIEAVLTTLAVVFLAAIMLIVVADVSMRYVFNRPFGWSYDLIGTYLMVGLFYLVVSSAYRVRAHINVDILHIVLPRTGQRVADLVTHLVGCAVFALIAWAGFAGTVTAFIDGDRLAGAYGWPTWPALGLVPLGAGLLALRLGLHAAAELAGLIAGRDFIPPVEDMHADTEAAR